MISSHTPREAFVWIWLPEATTPVVAGRLAEVGGKLLFNYGKSYLDRPNAIPIYSPELPLRQGLLPLPNELNMPGCLRDAAPDAWGRRVILNRLHSGQAGHQDTELLDELTYLLESGSDRIGALDFQLSPTEYVPRQARQATLEELLASAERVEQGIPLSPELDQALRHGSSIGGARPKAMIDTDEKKYIAKFSGSTDVYSVVKAEFVAMRLAALAGLQVAPVQLVRASGKDVLLVERFDRIKVETGWQRKAMVSALTLFGLDELMARYASYEDLAEIIRHRFVEPAETLRELFSRLAFNILCGNTDDHARNHAAFWNGRQLTLTPAYDICPQSRTGNEASQAMLIMGTNNMSRLEVCVSAASRFLLSTEEARAIIARLIASIQANLDTVCDEAQLSQVDKAMLKERQFLNPYALSGDWQGLPA
ncbi:MAG: type II toxin-antitoxin system HipA family toxin [Gammaproteobacteria bacterium]|nr:type II toxin-antitoxin system HipA family toxin [Gammaproteobacteria bacterium]